MPTLKNELIGTANLSVPGPESGLFLPYMKFCVVDESLSSSLEGSA